MTAQHPHDPTAVVLAGYALSRRRFLAALGAGWASGTGTALAGSVLVRPLHAQQPSPMAGIDMDPSGYRPTTRPPKPNAKPQLDKAQMEALEHQIGCACPCALDVYTCRTTDFSCGISPQMHRDVLRLIDGGYSADEIIAAFEDTYGEQVLMAPKKEGFNLAGYWMPFAALGTGAVVVAGLIRKWGRRAAEVQAASDRAHAGNGKSPLAIDATPEELARLEAAIRTEER